MKKEGDNRTTFCDDDKTTHNSTSRQKEEAMHIEDTQRLVTEIEMLKIVLYLVMGKRTRTEAG
jgi:hypothetical protein